MASTIFFEWAEYERSVNNEINLDFSQAELVSDRFSLDRALGKEVISIFVDSKITDDDLRKLKDAGLKKIAVRSVGTDMLNVELAKELGINVFRIASYSPESIAEHVYALLLGLVRNLNVQRELHEKEMHTRTTREMGRTLHGKTLGIYGVGRIGSIVAEIAKGFGMQIVFFDKFVESLEGASKVGSLQELVGRIDFLSIHVPLTDETRYSINSEVLNSAKQGMILINTSRGDVVDSNALVAALDSGKLSGAGVDVWDSGVVDDRFDKRLLRDNVIQTQHVAFFTYEAVKEILEQTWQNIWGEVIEKNQVC